MKDIRICELSCSNPKVLTQLPLNKDRFRFIYTNDNPDYLFVVISHLLYSNKIQKEFVKHYSSDKIVIFYGDEAISPDMNLFDYAIVYDDNFVVNDRVFRHPTSCFFQRYFWDEKYKNKLKNVLDADLVREYEKRKFCNFIYSNPSGNPIRKQVFDELNKYERVDSLGGYLNNVQIENTRFREDYFDISVRLKSNYRFSIAVENSNMPGYTSEKILSSFYANTIPVYWGNPSIVEEFNEKAFINLGQDPDFDYLRYTVSAINESKELWMSMINQPMCEKRQLLIHEESKQTYMEYLSHIFEQDVKNAKRIPNGTAVNGYGEYCLRMIESSSGSVPLKKRIEEFFQKRVKMYGKQVSNIFKRL